MANIENNISEKLRLLIQAHEIGYISSFTREEVIWVLFPDEKFYSYDSFRKFKKNTLEELKKGKSPQSLYEIVQSLQYKEVFNKRLFDKYFFRDLDDVFSEIELVENDLLNVSKNRVKIFVILYWYGIVFEELMLLQHKHIDFETNKILGYEAWRKKYKK